MSDNIDVQADAGMARYRSRVPDFVPSEWFAKVDEPPHRCGNCSTPFGRSSLPCRNDPNR